MVRVAMIQHAASGRFAIRRGDWVPVDGPTGDDNSSREPVCLKEHRS
jgi:hypothetical protein